MAKQNNNTVDLKQYEESIKGYADQIKKLSYVESVRKLPGLFIGSTGNNGWKGCVREIWEKAMGYYEKHPYF